MHKPIRLSTLRTMGRLLSGPNAAGDLNHIP